MMEVGRKGLLYWMVRLLFLKVLGLGVKCEFILL